MTWLVDVEDLPYLLFILFNSLLYGFILARTSDLMPYCIILPLSYTSMPRTGASTSCAALSAIITNGSYSLHSVLIMDFVTIFVKSSPFSCRHSILKWALLLESTRQRMKLLIKKQTHVGRGKKNRKKSTKKNF